jgi:hypothetical protein
MSGRETKQAHIVE